MNNNFNSNIEGEKKIVEDGTLNLFLIKTETRDAISKMLNFEEPQNNNALFTNKVIYVVQYGGHNIHKYNTMSRFNANIIV